MSEHQGLPVHGYKPQPEHKVILVNLMKILEEITLRSLDGLAATDNDTVDKRWLAIGRTNIEQGFMAVNRSIFQPGRIQGNYEELYARLRSEVDAFAAKVGKGTE